MSQSEWKACTHHHPCGPAPGASPANNCLSSYTNGLKAGLGWQPINEGVTTPQDST